MNTFWVTEFEDYDALFLGRLILLNLGFNCL